MLASLTRQPHRVAAWMTFALPAIALSLFALYWLGIPEISSTFAERLRLSRVILFCSGASLACLAAWKWSATQRLLQDFWHGASHPMNLAIYRIALFATIAWDPDVDYDRARVMFFSSLPHELRMDLPLMGWVTQNVPLSETLGSGACTLLRVFSITAMIGLFSRTSAALTAIIGLYALGIPQLFGQTNHYHHMVWFAGILATSRCGDFLSIDAIVSAVRRADRGSTEPPAESRVYALPLRFVWLLMGLIYFFPGFWKYWHSGLDWAFSDNFKHQLHLKWMQLGGWTPAFRIDQHPVLCRLGALSAIVFELTFILFIFFPRLRWIPALWGLAFHNLTFLLMRIAFITLQTSYVSLFDWRSMFRWLGARLHRERMSVLFDGYCKVSRRAVAVLRTVDLFDSTEYIDTRQRSVMEQRGLTWLVPQYVTADVHAIIGGRSWTGFEAYRTIIWRSPVVWPLLPAFYLWPIAGIGRSMYRRLANNLPLDAYDAFPPLVAPQPARAGGMHALIGLSVFLLAGNFVFGLMEERRGWPLTCYPPFSRILGPQTHVFRMNAVDAGGRDISWHEHGLVNRFSWPRYVSMMRLLQQRNDPKQFEALWRVACRYDPALSNASRVQFYDEVLWTAPDRQLENPVERRLFHESVVDSVASR